MKENNFKLEELEFIKNIFEKSTENYIFIFDLKNDHYIITERASQVFQLSKFDFYNATSALKEVIHPKDYYMVAADLDEIKRGRKTNHALEYRWKLRNGRYVFISCKGEAVYNDSGEYLVGEITEIGKQSRFDNITGLYLENVLETHYNQDAHEKGDTGTIILIGIDNFKEINEKHGEVLANSVLEAVAGILLSITNDPRMVYRMRGDEFAVIIPKAITPESADSLKNLYKRIRRAVDRYIESNGYQLFFTISAGGLLFDTKTYNYQDVIRDLRFALHQAKIKGKNNYVMFSKKEYYQYIRKIDIQEHLRMSIDKGYKGFELYYQPIFGTAEEKVVGAEALIRWNSIEYGFMSPVEFIPLLEESALIIPLGRWIIETASEQCQEWSKFIPDFIMHINLSFVQVIKSDVVKDVVSGIKSSKLDSSHFVIEVTESGEIDSSVVVHNVLQQLHSKGFELAIDDFGTGYSNLRYIKDLMFGIIKIDRAFIKDINTSDKNYKVVKAIIEMVHGLDLKVCVEGVETKEELDIVRELNADTVQGFYYGKPVPAFEFEKLHFSNN